MDAVGESGGRFASPRWNYPEYPHGSVIEIRVHGVGGEPPSAMTRDHHPGLVGGDKTAGFYRARNPIVGRIRENPDPKKREALHVREVLSWGGQTSGTTRHALWVLLTPLALFNVAGRMHVVQSWRGGLHRALCRVLALTMTLGVIGVACGIAFDLLAVQCGAIANCIGTSQDGPAVLAPLRHFDDDMTGRLGIVALLPAALVLLLWSAGRYKTKRLEGHATNPASEAEPRDDEPTHLADHDFWRNAWPTSRLRGLHASAAFGWIALALGLSLQATTSDTAAVWQLVWVIGATTVLLAVVTVAFPVVAAPGPRKGMHRWLTALRLPGLGALAFAAAAATLSRIPIGFGSDGGADAALAEGRWAAIVMVVGVALVAWWVQRAVRIKDPADPDVSLWRNVALAGGAVLLAWGLTRLQWLAVPSASGEPVSGLGNATALSDRATDWLLARVFPGLFAAPYLPLLILVAFQGILILALAGAAAFPDDPRREKRSQLDTDAPVFANLVAVVVTLLSLLLITAVGASLHALTLDWLGERALTAGARQGEVDLVLPWWYGVVAVVVAFVLPLLAGIVALIRWAWRRGDKPVAYEEEPAEPARGSVASYLQAAYAEAEITPAPDPTSSVDQARLKKIARLWMTQRLIRDGGHVLAAIVTLSTGAILAVGAWVVWRGDAGPVDELTTPAVWIVTLIPVAAFGVIRRSLKDPETRRNVGRMWDVLTFWPRVTHPFAPPCYGEALVPMLEDRVRKLTHLPPHEKDKDHAYRVVLAGHSQGSVVALAAAARLHDSDGSRVAMVSYGSPIAILYERYFRATLQVDPGQSVIDLIGTRVGSWHHLFSLTEPFAFPFWEVSVPPTTDISAAARRGWDITRHVRSVRAACPECATEEPAGNGQAAHPRRVDLLVRDPDLWMLPDESPATPTTHSTYHRHCDVDKHLRMVVQWLAEPVEDPREERRSVSWWRPRV